MTSGRELFINAVRSIAIRGSVNIPTVLFYKGREPLIGYDALEKAGGSSLLNEDFKLDLGRYDPTSIERAKFDTAGGGRRTALGLANDFVNVALQQVSSSLVTRGLSLPKRVLVAEPIAMGKSQGENDAWLANYRASIRRVLYGKFTEIDFLPEPFAVFQYYRYGIRHPLLSQRLRHVALVLDFGGGTFDVSVIETTGLGDISQSGRNSRPLAAFSLPVGGFYFNRKIAEALLAEVIDKGVDKKKVREAWKQFQSIQNADDASLDLTHPKVCNFVRNMKKTLFSVERGKMAICQSVSNWALSADLSSAAAWRVPVPRDPFEEHPEWPEIRLDAARLRSLFVDELWNQRLKSAITGAIDRAHQELSGKRISIVLLSGGSANVRWLRQLMERDLQENLIGAEILELNENFQEIVSKGLAVECARRFFTAGSGDFKAVTYNRLCLVVRPDGGELEVRRLKPRFETVPAEELGDGVLLPSASILSGLIGQPLRWRVKLGHPPRRMLDYYFLRGSFDPEDIQSLHNVDTRIITPQRTNFGSSIDVELSVREDGTSFPAFVYGHGSLGDNETRVEGKPFYLDMTFGSTQAIGETYLGFDFGTSNSSFCFVEASDVKIYESRAHDKNWLELNDLISVVPYPMAATLAAYMAETSKDRMDTLGREAVEAALGLFAYIAYSEYCSMRGKHSSHIFKGMQHRSTGPLWNMLKQTLAEGAGKALFCREMSRMLRNPWFGELDHVVSNIAQSKHGKTSEIDYPRILALVGNLANAVFSTCLFGYFEDVKRKPFRSSFCGTFRNARGPARPFVDMYEYEGRDGFSPEMVFLCHAESGQALPLSPLLLWGLNVSGSRYEEPDLYLYDRSSDKDKMFGYKSVQPREELRIECQDDFGPLFAQLQEMKSEDPRVHLIEGISLRHTRSAAGYVQSG